MYYLTAVLEIFLTTEHFYNPTCPNNQTLSSSWNAKELFLCRQNFVTIIINIWAYSGVEHLAV